MKRGVTQKRSWFVMTLFGFALLGLLLYTKRTELGDAVEAIKTADIRYLLLLPVFQATSFFWVGKFYQTMFSYFDAHFSPWRAWAVVAALTFVNQILPSGGMSGLTYLAYGFRNMVSAGKTGLIQLSRYILSMSVYVILTPVVLVMVYLSGEGGWLENTYERALGSPTAWITSIGFIIIVGVAFVALRDRTLTRKIARNLEHAINRVGQFFKRGKKLIKSNTILNMVHEFHDGFEFMKSQRLKVLKPFGFMILSTMFELAIVYTAFKAVGGDISIGVLLVSFIAANIAGVVSVIPGDVGVHESVMIIMLSSLGIDGSIAISATLLYRIFNKMIFLPLGFYFYSRLLRPAGA